jgi:hypothetical protein
VYEQYACLDALTPYTPGRLFNCRDPDVVTLRNNTQQAILHVVSKWPTVMVTIQNAFLHAESHLVWRGMWTKDDRQQLLPAFEQDELTPNWKEVQQPMTDVSSTLTGAALDMRTLKTTPNNDRRLPLESTATEAFRYNGKSKEIRANKR